MARQISRHWSKDRIRVRYNDKESNSPPPPPLPSLPPPLPPSLLPPPPPPPPPQTSFLSNPYEVRRRKREERTGGICEDESCYDAWTRSGDRNSSKGFDTSFPQSQRYIPPMQRFRDIRDVDTNRQSFGQQVYVVSPMKEKLKGDKIEKLMTHVRDEVRGHLPPAIPTLDFPVETRTPKREYRRVDEYDEDPRLRAELYPLEEKLVRKEVQGTYRQAPETIEILPERSIKEQDTSELNLVPTQRIREDRRAEPYPEETDIKAGIGVRNPNANPQDFGYSVDRRSKETEKKDPRRSNSEITEERNAKKAQAIFDPLEQNRTWQDNFPTRSPVANKENLHPTNASSSSGGRDSPILITGGERGRYSYIVHRTESKKDRRSSRVPGFREPIITRREVLGDDVRLREMNGRNTQADNPKERVTDKRIPQGVDYRERSEDRRGIPAEDLRERLEDGRKFLIDDFREKLVHGRGIPLHDHSELLMDRGIVEDVREPLFGRRIPTDDFRTGRYYSVHESPDLKDLQTDRHMVEGFREHTDMRNPRLSVHTDAIDSREERLDKQNMNMGGKSRIMSMERRSEGMRGIAQERRMTAEDIQGLYEVRSFQAEDDRGSGRRAYERSHFKEDIDGTYEKHSGFAEPRRSEMLYDSEKENRKSNLYVQPGTDLLRRRQGGDPTKMTAGGTRTSAQYEVLKQEPEDIPVERRDSVMLPGLEESEKEFHELVAAGDVAAVRIFLREHPGFNINCVNYQQISALHVAVHEQNEAMVDFLLEQPSLDCSDCALYAIKEGNVRIVEKIMDKLRETSPSLEFAATTHSVDFPDYMTPIILAAQQGNYEIIDFLIKRDHIIPPVHNPYCKCEACKADLQKYDRLKYSTMKLNLYKAISNPMYIFHVTDDPFQRAFDLTQELLDAAKVFPQFKTSYEELWRDLRSFTVELIGCCRNSQEVEIILKKSANNIAGSITFPRLQYAIDLKQKEFVSHPYTQAVLVDAWTGDLLEWKVRSPLMQALAVFPRIPMLPVMAVMCMFLPNHKLVKKWKTPVNKMISSFASYLIFLIILFLESNLDKTNQKRGPPNSGLESIIIIYVIGYIWLNIRLCFRLGPKRFFSTLWHWFDCTMLILLTLTIIFWIASLADITANNEIDLPRKYWNAFDPELIAEGCFAVAVIMAFFRLNMFLSLNYHLGPLQVSIGKMTLDIFRFIIIFSIIILSWCAGLCRFYQPYDGMVQKDASGGPPTTQVSSFVSFSMTLKTLFWAIFGMSPIESADVVIENLPGDTPDTTIINHHEFTEAVGYIAFALFQFLSVVVVLNMLVACMANTLTKVIDNVTVEWVFGRSQIYLNFMAATTLPPPFNLLPTASGIKSTFLWLKLLAKPSNGQRAKCNISHCCYIESETEEYINSEFPSLMSELAQRYLRLKGESVETHDDLEELKYEMKELLRKMDKIITIRKNS